MVDEKETLTTLQNKQEEKLFQGGYVPPVMKMDGDGDTTKKGYVPPALKPSASPTPEFTPTEERGEGKPRSNKTSE